ncbi:MAG: hypothetical protein ABI360_03675 [Allobranchiibius sp.]
MSNSPVGDAGDGSVHDVTDSIATAILAIPGVHDLHAGTAGQFATYLPGRRVNGVRAIDGGYDVHIVLAWGHPVSATADAVRAVVQQINPGRVDVTIEDVARKSVARLEAAQ